MNLQRLLSSQPIYKKQFPKFLQTLLSDSQKQNMLRNIVLFCKQVFSSNSNQRKKYLSLQLIKDIFQNIKMQYYEKLVDEYLATKIYNMIQSDIEGRTQNNVSEDKEYGQKLYNFAVETIVFWAKRLSFMQKSVFGQVYEELRKMKVEINKQFVYYKQQMIVQLWKQQQTTKQPTNPLLLSLSQKFHTCKQTLQQTINTSILNDQQVPITPILQHLRQFLLYFFINYRKLQPIQTQQRDIIIVYFHILNNLYKKIYIICFTKEIFDVVYPAEYDSVDRMDIVELAGVFKYNALTVFQRIHQRIEKEQAILGPFKISINLQQNQKPPLPSGCQKNIIASRTGSIQRFRSTLG